MAEVDNTAILKKKPVTPPVPSDSLTSPRPKRRWLRKIGRVLWSPLAIFLTLPLFACTIGIVMAWQGHSALQTVTDGIALDRFYSQSKHASRRTQQILGQAPSLTSRWHAFLRRHKGTPPTPLMAQHLVDLMSHREGIAWMSYGRDDGQFWGVFRNLKGEYIFTQRIVQPEGHNDLKDYRVEPGTMTLLRHKPNFKYDHRIRAWYKLGQGSKGIAWTKPYTFFATGVAGISCVKKLRINGVKGVTTVDYSLNSLSSFVEKLNASQQGSAFLFTREKMLLAYPGGRHQMMGLGGKGLVGLPKASQHPDPILRAFFHTKEVAQIDATPTARFEYAHNKARIFGSIMPSRISKDLTWYVGAFIPRAKLVAPVKQHRKDALEITLLTLLLSIQLAALLSWGVWRSRNALALAHQETKEAKQEAYALGSYNMTRLIGGGGMGEVWEARHQMLARPAAIKLIRSDIMTSGEHDPIMILKHFEREARATAKLSSPHTVRLYDYGTSDDGHFFYVMELLQGLDVRQLVLREGPQPVGRVLHVMQQVCVSLAEAHNNGLVHRDLKPANVFLCAQGTQLDFVKVLDFGVVHIDTEDELNDKAAVGTPSIMSPEQIKEGGQPDGRTDLYALGCLAHWMLTGSNIFQATTVQDLLVKHMRATPPSARLSSPFEIPEELDELILGCLAKDPQHRPASAETLLLMLEAVPVPEDQCWDDEAIQSWWSTHFPKLRAVGWHANALEERLLTTPVPASHPTLKTPFPGSPFDGDHLSISMVTQQQPSPADASDFFGGRSESSYTIKRLHKTAWLKKRKES